MHLASPAAASASPTATSRSSTGEHLYLTRLTAGARIQWERRLTAARLKSKIINYQAFALGVGIGAHYGGMPGGFYATIKTAAATIGMDPTVAERRFKELCRAGFFAPAAAKHVVKSGPHKGEGRTVWLFVLELADPKEAEAVRKEARQHHALHEGAIAAQGNLSGAARPDLSGSGQGTAQVPAAPGAAGTSPAPPPHVKPCEDTISAAEAGVPAGTGPVHSNKEDSYLGG
jgi:hypothetical protein